METELNSFSNPNPNSNSNTNPNDAAETQPNPNPSPNPLTNPNPDPTPTPPPTKDEIFRSRFVMPLYLRIAMASAIRSKSLDSSAVIEASEDLPPPYPLLVLINSRSGGRQGPALQSVLDDLLSHEQVFTVLFFCIFLQNASEKK